MGLASKANAYYKFFIGWRNEGVKKAFSRRNVFDFPYVKPWNSDYINRTTPCVLLATPGMLHAGTSLAVFGKWCEDERNLVVLPGYCSPQTVGGKLLAGHTSMACARLQCMHSHSSSGGDRALAQATQR